MFLFGFLWVVFCLGSNLSAFEHSLSFNNIPVHTVTTRMEEHSRTFALKRKSKNGANLRISSFSSISLDNDPSSSNASTVDFRYDQKLYGLVDGLSLQTGVRVGVGSNINRYAVYSKNSQAVETMKASSRNEVFPFFFMGTEWIAIDNDHLRLTPYVFGQLDGSTLSIIRKSDIYKGTTGERAHSAGFGADLQIKCVNTKKHNLDLIFGGQAREFFGMNKMHVSFLKEEPFASTNIANLISDTISAILYPQYKITPTIAKRRDFFQLGGYGMLGYRYKLFFIDLEARYDLLTQQKATGIDTLSALVAANDRVDFNGLVVAPEIRGNALRIAPQNIFNGELRMGFQDALTNGKYFKNDMFGFILNISTMHPKRIDLAGTTMRKVAGAFGVFGSATF